jgi:class 3 adenylate cyclase/PAS domain-containing protein
MSEARVRRRLAAILAADVVGYGRLMQADEEGTLEALNRHRREFFDPNVAKHGGRVFKAMGDGFLVEFASVLDAARCAVEIQRGMAWRNGGVPEERRFLFRVGINLGDVIVDGDDLHGEGVNLAVRLQGLADPGGIACSAAVRREVGKKLEARFSDRGERTVKSTAEPVHVYFIDCAAAGAPGHVRAATGTGPIAAGALSDLIGAIYDCALDPSRWPATMEAICAALDFRVAALALQEFPAGKPLMSYTAGFAPEYLARFDGYMNDVYEIWGGVERIATVAMDAVLINTKMNPGRTWRRTASFRRFVVPQRLIDAAAIILARDQRTLGSLTFGRHRDKGPIGEREREALRLLLPHAQRSVAISKLLDIKTVEAATFSATLDAMGCGIALLARDLRIVHANAAALAQFKAGNPVADRGGYFTVRQAFAAKALTAAVEQAADDEAMIGRRGFGIPAKRADGSPCVLNVLPLRHGPLRGGLVPDAAAAVFIATPATVKTHLLRVYDKTGAGGRAGLVRLAASLSLPV